MSALSVLSPIIPTAAGGTGASAETAASDGLFAGMVAAVAPSAKASDGDSDALVDLPPAESDAVEAPVVLDAVVAAPAWPPVALIAPAPPPATPRAETADAGTAAATPPLSAVSPTLDTVPLAPPIIDGATPVDSKPAAPSLLNTAVAPAVPALAAKAAAPAQGRETTPAPAQTQPVKTDATLHPTPAAPVSPVAAAASGSSPRSSEVETAPLAQRQASPSAAPTGAPASDDVPPTKPAASSAAPAIQTDEPRADAAAQARTPSPASPLIAVSATRGAPLPVAASQTQTAPEPLKAPTDAPRVEAGAQPQQAAPQIVAPAPRPVAMTPPQPVAAPPAEDPEQIAAIAAVIPADAEGEAAPSKAQPAQQAAPPAPAQPVAPARNGSARLDDRPSNAATSDAQTNLKSEIQGGSRSILPASTAAAPTTPSSPAPADSAKAIAPLDAAALDTSAAPDLAPSQQVLDTQNAALPASRDLGLSQLSRATVETTAQIAAQILKKLDGRSTRFDMALTPEDLGRVDVSMEIDSDGRLTARLAFDNPAAATDLRGRADELRRQLQDAGFQLAQDSLEFSERNPSSGFGGGAFDRAPDRRAFAGAARLATEADTALPAPGAWASLSQTRDRVDLKV